MGLAEELKSISDEKAPILAEAARIRREAEQKRKERELEERVLARVQSLSHTLRETAKVAAQKGQYFVEVEREAKHFSNDLMDAANLEAYPIAFKRLIEVFEAEGFDVDYKRKSFGYEGPEYETFTFRISWKNPN